MGETVKSVNMCKAPGLPLCEPEELHISLNKLITPNIELAPPAKTILCECVEKADEVKAEEAQEGEEEEVSVSQSATNEELMQLKEIEAELLEKKNLVDRIGEQISVDIPECPSEDPCVNLQLELQKSELHPYIYELQRENHQLRQQLSQAKASCKAIDLSLQYLHNSLCRDLNAGAILQRRLDELNSFKINLEHEQSLCRQRYRHLQNDKYEWVDFQGYVRKTAAGDQQELTKLVQRLHYIQPKQDAVRLLKQVKRKALDVQSHLASKMLSLSQRVGQQTTLFEMSSIRRVASSLSIFKQRSEYLLANRLH